MACDELLGSKPVTNAANGPVAVLAPLSGVSDLAFRRLAARFGAERVVTEMVAAEGFLRGDEEARLRSAGRGISPHVIQLVGRNPARMGEAARLAEAAGADVIDINMGCPAKRVTGGLSGSALMREPDLALAMMASVVAAVSVPVTVKMRLGWDDRSRNAAELARRGAELGVAGFAVHGRTRQQFYEGRASWSAIREVVDSVSVPVLANGDILSAADAAACLAQSGAAGVMIGRAAVGQPWLVGEVAAALTGQAPPRVTPRERAEAAAEHYEGLLALYGTALGIRHARKHLAAYADCAAAAGYGLPPADRAELVRSVEPTAVLALLTRLYAEPIQRAA
jgi:nifR3 family TIM-barrel protein